MDKYERFEAWLRENGAKFEQVRIVRFAGGLVARERGSVLPNAAAYLDLLTHPPVLLLFFPILWHKTFANSWN